MAAANLSDNNPPMAASAHHSRNSGQSMGSPKSRRSSRPVSSPWTQIVRGELEINAVVPSSQSNMTSPTAVVEPVPSSSSSSSSSSSPSVAEEPVGERSESGCGSQANVGNKPAWNKLSNGAAAEVGPVMGAVSWPALSESTRFATKSSLESPKAVADGSAGSACQGIGNSPSSPQKEVSSGSSISTPTATHRQKSMKHSGASNSHNGGPSQQSAISGSVIETTPSIPSSKDQNQRTTFVSQSHNDHNYQQQRSSFRGRGSGYPRGDGSHHHNHGTRRDHDRGNHDWNSHRNYGQPQRVVQRYIRPPPPPSAATFIHPPMRPLGGPIHFPEFVPSMVYVAAPPPPEALRGVPFVAQIPPNAVFFPALDPQLCSAIVKQIDYYFSDENLIKDTFLRGNMDEQGWVPISLIATFQRVLDLTDNIPLILDALRTSTLLEVQGDRVRRRNDYSRWILQSKSKTSDVAAPLSPANSKQDMLAAGVQSLTLETIKRSISESRGDPHVEALQSRSPRNFNSQSQQPGTGQLTIETGLDHSFSARN